MTHSAPSEPATLPTRRKPTRVWRTSLAALVGVVAIAMLVLWLQAPPPRFELITDNDYEHRTKRFALIRAAWITRFSSKIFGFAPVEISAGHRVTGPGGASDLEELPPPTFSTNAVRVWILKSNEVARAQSNLRTDDSARWRVLTTSGGIPSVISTGGPTGTGSGSIVFENHPRIRGRNVDLAIRFASVVAGPGNGRVGAATTNHIAFHSFLKPHEGGILFDGSDVLFIWVHAPAKR